MLHEMRQMQQAIDEFGDALDLRLTHLRTDMKVRFDDVLGFHDEQRGVNDEQRRVNEEQRRVNDEQRRVNEEQRRVNEEQHRVNDEQQWVNEELHRVNEEIQRSVSRMSASFDQDVAEAHTDLMRRIRGASYIWSHLTELTAEMEGDFTDFRHETENLSRRVDAIEKRLAG